MSAKQRLITDVFAKHKSHEIRSATKALDHNATNDGQIPVVADDPVTQEELREKEIEVLKQFDLCWEYGPCTGISRLERWDRADRHGMNPPQEVRKLILRNAEQEEYTQNLWRDYPL